MSTSRAFRIERIITLEEFPYKNTALWEMKKALRFEAAKQRIKIGTMKVRETTGSLPDTIKLSVYALGKPKEKKK